MKPIKSTICKYNPYRIREFKRTYVNEDCPTIVSSKEEVANGYYYSIMPMHYLVFTEKYVAVIHEDKAAHIEHGVRTGDAFMSILGDKAYINEEFLQKYADIIVERKPRSKCGDFGVFTIGCEDYEPYLNYAYVWNISEDPRTDRIEIDWPDTIAFTPHSYINVCTRNRCYALWVLEDTDLVLRLALVEPKTHWLDIVDIEEIKGYEAKYVDDWPVPTAVSFSWV